MSEVTIRPKADWLYVPCTHCTVAWSAAQVQTQLPEFSHWSVEFSATKQLALKLWRKYAFSNFEGVKMAVHEIMHLADDEDHHPEVSFGYNTMTVTWSTHSAGGISNNDWACAAKLDNALAHIG